MSLRWTLTEAVRTQLSFTLNRLSFRSPIAVAALLETPGTADWLKPESIQETLRHRPVPAALRTVYTRRTQAVALLFAGILGTFSALHLFVYLFDNRNRTDGLYALFSAVGAIGTLLNDLGSVDSSSWYRWMGPACLALSLTLALRLLYALFAPRIPLVSLGVEFALLPVRDQAPPAGRPPRVGPQLATGISSVCHRGRGPAGACRDAAGDLAGLLVRQIRGTADRGRPRRVRPGAIAGAVFLPDLS